MFDMYWLAGASYLDSFTLVNKNINLKHGVESMSPM